MITTTTPRSVDTLKHVQKRLAAHGCRLELRRDPDGWCWDAAGQPVQTRRSFRSAAVALDHANAYTAIWFPLPGEQRINPPA